MARFGRDHKASTLLVAGVRFMGETAKILSPEKRVLMPTLDATVLWILAAPSKTLPLSVTRTPTVLWWCTPTLRRRSKRADWW